LLASLYVPGPVLEVLALPGSFSHADLQLRKAAFEGFELAALAAGFGVVGGEILELGTNEARQGGVALEGNFADFFDESVILGQGDVH